MIKTWRYSAISRTGQEVHGIMHGDRKEILERISSANMSLDHMGLDFTLLFNRSCCRLSGDSLAQLFEEMHNMYGVGAGISQILHSIKETVQDPHLILVLKKIEEEISRGRLLSDAIAGVGAFPWIVYGTLRAGEQAGRLQDAFMILGQYFKRISILKNKITGALVYPGIVFVLLTALMFFIGLKVVPQLQHLLPPDTLKEGLTSGVVSLSALIRQYLVYFIVLPVIVSCVLLIWRQKRKDQFEQMIYQVPILGNIIKDIDLSFYFLNLSVLLKSGVPLLRAISDLSAINKSQASKHFFNIRDFMFGGMSFWEAVNRDIFFPKVISSTLRRGEEIARLDEYSANLAEYFEKRVASQMEAVVHFIQPLLLGLGGVFLVVIAFAFLVPIYGSLTTIAGS